jgi:hypothetical protein
VNEHFMTRTQYAFAVGAVAILASIAVWQPWGTARADWIRGAQQEVRAYGPPSAADFEAAASGEWATRKHLVFSNGWAAFKMHSIHDLHDPNTVGDAAVLLTSEGEMFRTFSHLRGIPEWHLPYRPSSWEDYLRSYGLNQKWKQIPRAQPASQDNVNQPFRAMTNQTPPAAAPHR